MGYIRVIYGLYQAEGYFGLVKMLRAGSKPEEVPATCGRYILKARLFEPDRWGGAQIIMAHYFA